MIKKILYFSLLFVLIFLVGCSSPQSTTIATGGSTTTTTTTVSPWMETQFEDVRTGKSFKVSDFKEKKVLLESFAVWCPTCTRQQQEIEKLHNELGDSFVSISLDTDVNEDKAKIQEHLDRNGFDWLYAISPEAATRSLIKDFGIGVVNAPTAPVVLICEDGSTRLLPRGLKKVDELKSEIAKGC